MRYGIMVCAAALVMTLGGCGVMGHHNDVLVFGTSTKLAVDVSAPVQNASVPEFTVGYKRQEGVWMPLKANTAADPAVLTDEQYKQAMAICMARRSQMHDPVGNKPEDKALCDGQVLSTQMYVARSEGVDSKIGGSKQETDTYSVFASFGGRGALSGTSASGAMAQFFATGIAAQRLGANPGLAAALNANGATAVAEVAKAESDRAKADAVIAASALAAFGVETNAFTAIDTYWKTNDCADPATKNADFLAVLDQAGKEPGVGTWFTNGVIRRATSKAMALAILKTGDAQVIVAFDKALAAKCPRT